MTAITKEKEITPPKGSILQDYLGENSISLLADKSQLPKTAVIDRVRLMGSFKVNKKEVKDVILEDIPDIHVNVRYHQEYTDENYRVVATMNFPAGVPEDLLDKVLNYFITDFKVYYHEEAIMGAE